MKIIIITDPQPLKAYVQLNLFQCHIDWLRGRGINFACSPEEENLVYSRWANANRAHPLLVECLELYKDTVTNGIKGMRPLLRNIEQWDAAKDNAMKRLACGIARTAGRGHLSVEEVRTCFGRQYTLNEILDEYAGSFKPKDMEASKHDFADIQNCQQSLEAAYQELNDYCNSSGIGRFSPCHNPAFEVVEYDEMVVEPVLNVKFNAAKRSYHEELRLKPLDIENGTHVTEAALKYFFEGGDDGFQSLVDYLRNRSVTVV